MVYYNWWGAFKSNERRRSRITFGFNFSAYCGLFVSQDEIAHMKGEILSFVYYSSY